MYKNIPITGPWGGIRDDVGRPYTPLNAFDDSVNFFTLKGRLQTRPKLLAFGTAAPDSKVIRLVKSFMDKNGNYHTLVLTTDTPYAITASPFAWNALTLPGGITTLGQQARPFGWAAINNRIYFSQGPTKVLYADGSSAVLAAGDVQGGSRFMGVLASRLILAYTTEASVDSPRRIRWCRAGTPNNWTSFSAGFADLMDVPDTINGYATSGQNGLIFRENGITAMVPTGVGTSPFAFSHFAVQPTGIGNKYPYSLAAYGNQHIIFVSADDIYRVRGMEVTPIGRSVKKKIFADLALANGTVWGAIIPDLGAGYDFLSYWLVIPKSGSTAVWVFQMDDETWVRFYSSAGILSAIGSAFTT